MVPAPLVLLPATTPTTAFLVPSTSATTSTTTNTAATPKEAPGVPCPAHAVMDVVEQTLPQLDAAAGGVLPAAGLIGLVAQATGCTRENALITILGLVIDLGKGLPNPLAGTPPLLPPLPIADVTSLLGPLLAPLTASTVAPLCATVGTVVSLYSTLLTVYPWPLSSADTGTLLFYAGLVCGALSGAG